MLQRLRTNGIPVGGALIGVGGALTVGYLLFTLQGGDRSFWRWPGVLGLIIVTAGAIALVIGFFGSGPRDDNAVRVSPGRQEQKGGANSQLFQAGGDLTVGDVNGSRVPPREVPQPDQRLQRRPKTEK